MPDMFALEGMMGQGACLTCQLFGGGAECLDMSQMFGGVPKESWENLRWNKQWTRWAKQVRKNKKNGNNRRKRAWQAAQKRNYTRCA